MEDGGFADDDTRVDGVIAADPQHPACSLAYMPDSGASAARYADGPNC